MPTVVVLPVPLTPTISMTCGGAVIAIGRSTAAKTRRISCLTRSRRLAPLRDCALDGGDDAVGGGDADVGRDQQLFERLDRVDVDRTGALVPARRRCGRSRRSARRSAWWCARAPRGSGRRIPSPRSYLGLRLRPLPAQHQRLDRRAHVRPSVQHLGHLRGDRQLDAVALAERERGAGGATPSATIFMPARISGSERPRASSMPTWRLRLRLPVQVSTRSPRPLRPASVSRRPPPAQRQTRDLGEPARDQRRQRVVAEAEPLDHAGRNRDDVLHRRADLDADDIVAAVQAEGRSAEFRWTRSIAAASCDAARIAVGSWRATSMAKLGPDSTTTGCVGAGLLRDHFRHAQQRVRLESLGRADDHRARRPARATRAASRRGSRAREPQTRRGRRRASASASACVGVRPARATARPGR